VLRERICTSGFESEFYHWGGGQHYEKLVIRLGRVQHLGRNLVVGVGRAA